MFYHLLVQNKLLDDNAITALLHKYDNVPFYYKNMTTCDQHSHVTVIRIH